MLNDAHRDQLRDLAYRSIKNGLETGQPLAIDLEDFPPELQQHRATFVTLQRNKQLRGCIGMLKPERPLAEDVVQNAWAAAFRDTRFTPLSASELEGLDIHISILSEPEAMEFTSEQDLIEQIRPGVDGLILEDDFNRGTFLPSVWESLPTAAEFLSHLKLKAGLPQDYWSDTLQVQRYTVEEF